jgi:hypothetical protein
MNEELKCDKNALENNYSEYVRKCDQQGLSEEVQYSQLDVAVDCLKGLYEGSFKSIVDFAYAKAISNIEAQNAFIKSCDQACRMQLAKESNLYRNLSAQEIANIPTESLLVEAQDSKNIQNDLKLSAKILSHPIVIAESNLERQVEIRQSTYAEFGKAVFEKAKTLTRLSIQYIEGKGVKLACVNPRERTQMVCMGAMQVVGLAMPASYAAKKSYKLLFAVKDAASAATKKIVLKEGLFKTGKLEFATTSEREMAHMFNISTNNTEFAAKEISEKLGVPLPPFRAEAATKAILDKAKELNATFSADVYKSEQLETRFTIDIPLKDVPAGLKDSSISRVHSLGGSGDIAIKQLEVRVFENKITVLSADNKAMIADGKLIADDHGSHGPGLIINIPSDPSAPLQLTSGLSPMFIGEKAKEINRATLDLTLKIAQSVHPNGPIQFKSVIGPSYQYDSLSKNWNPL